MYGNSLRFKPFCLFSIFINTLGILFNEESDQIFPNLLDQFAYISGKWYSYIMQCKIYVFISYSRMDERRIACLVLFAHGISIKLEVS